MLKADSDFLNVEKSFMLKRWTHGFLYLWVTSRRREAEEQLDV